MALVHEHAGTGLAAVAVSSNSAETHPQDGPDRMVEDAKQFGARLGTLDLLAYQRTIAHRTASETRHARTPRCLRLPCPLHPNGRCRNPSRGFQWALLAGVVQASGAANQETVRHWYGTSSLDRRALTIHDVAARVPVPLSV